MVNKNNLSENCPHCGNKLNLTAPGYFYGSPFRVCPNCKNTYVDWRFHEIAVEGVREEDTHIPTGKERAKSVGNAFIFLAIAVVALIVMIVMTETTGWLNTGLIFALGFGLIAFFVNLSEAFKHGAKKKVAEIEVERQNSLQRMQNPQYVQSLKDIGYLS